MRFDKEMVGLTYFEKYEESSSSPTKYHMWHRGCRVILCACASQYCLEEKLGITNPNKLYFKRNTSWG